MWGSLLSAVLLAVAACDRQALALSTHRRTTCVSGSRAAAILRPTSSDEHGESQLARPTRSSLATMKGGAEAPSVILPLSGCILLSLITGSFYVWSMLLPALEESLGVSRTSLSLVNSIANICFTLGTTHFAPRLFASRRLSIAGVALVW
mmetsp:Transcript_49336/g.139688  ORF Transcript_49336/g.139688 Transcript_49336/m.139688 type:complete len:150 (+) Transcript_49336:175-624(+)